MKAGVSRSWPAGADRRRQPARCHDESGNQCLMPQLAPGPTSDNQGSGFYSKADYIDLVRLPRPAV